MRRRRSRMKVMKVKKEESEKGDQEKGGIDIVGEERRKKKNVKVGKLTRKVKGWVEREWGWKREER